MKSVASTEIAVTLDAVREAKNRISGEIIRTPLVLSEGASDQAGVPVHLKLESLQRTGSFKVRGALSKVITLTPEERQHLLGARKGEGLLFARGARLALTIEASPAEHRLATTAPRELAEMAAVVTTNGVMHAAGR